MSLSFFIAHRLYCEKKEGRQISRPAVLIAKTGIAVGLAVMLVAVCVIVGFKSEVRDKIVGFGGHVQINNLEQMQPYEPLAIGIDDTLINSLAAFPNVKHIQTGYNHPSDHRKHKQMLFKKRPDAACQKDCGTQENHRADIAAERTNQNAFLLFV